MPRLLSRFLLLGMVACVVLAGAKAAPVRGQAQSNMFLGRIDGTDAFVAVVTDGDRITAYACDGAENGIADSFSGFASGAVNGAVTLASDDSAAQLTIQADTTALSGLLSAGGTLTGSLQTVDGQTHGWSADQASGPGALYHSDDQFPDGNGGEGWWIVLNDGDVRGTYGLRSVNATFGPTTVGMTAVRNQFRGRPRGLMFPPVPPRASRTLLTGLTNTRVPVRVMLPVRPIPPQVLLFIQQTGTVPPPLMPFFSNLGFPPATTLPPSIQQFFPPPTTTFDPTTFGFDPLTGSDPTLAGFDSFPQPVAPLDFPSFPVTVQPFQFPQ
jgi:hypothetical protein